MPEPQHFVGVRTTKIYCYPWCTAPQPKPENVTLYATRAEAEKAGLRPCRACFPHLPLGSWEDHKTHVSLTVPAEVHIGEDRTVQRLIFIQNTHLAIRVEHPATNTIEIHFENVDKPPKKSIRIEAARHVWDWLNLGNPHR